MDNELIRNALMLLQWLTTLALAMYAHNIGKQRATTGAIDDLNKRLNEKCQRITRLEGDLKAMPTRDELGRIHERIDEIIENSRQNNLMLGEVLGQLKQINGGK